MPSSDASEAFPSLFPNPLLPQNQSSSPRWHELQHKLANQTSPLTSITLACVMHKTLYKFPNCGGRKVDYLKGTISALALSLSHEEIRETD